MIPGRPTPTRTINRFVAAVGRLSGLHPSAPLSGRAGPGGSAWAADLPERIDARLAGSVSPYSWSEVFLDATHTPPIWRLLIDGRAGTANAYEYNAAPSLDDKLVTLTPVGESWYKFPYPRHGLAHSGPGPCTFTVTVVDAATGDPVSGIPVSIAGTDGPTFSGDTDGSGVFTVTIAAGDPVPAYPRVTASYAGCSFGGWIYCNEPLTLYACLATVELEPVDDAGGAVPGVVFEVIPLFPWGCASLSGSTASFAWLGPDPPPEGGGGETYPLLCPAGSSYIGGVTFFQLAPSPLNARDGTYWESCMPPACVTCGVNPPYRPVFYRRSVWLAGPCCANGCVGSAGAIPKTLHVTITGPDPVAGALSGATIALDWAPGSWDGDLAALGGVLPPRMIFDSGCLGGNGAGGRCYTTDAHGCTVEGDFFAYGSCRLTLTITPGAGAIGEADNCTAVLTLQNYWDGACTNVDRPPLACPPDPIGGFPDATPPRRPLCGPVDCRTAQGAIVPGGLQYTGQWPMAMVWNLYAPASPVFQACNSPVDWAGSLDLGCGTGPYGNIATRYDATVTE